MARNHWPKHLIVARDDLKITEPGPLMGDVPDYTACGVRVYRKTWRGYTTTNDRTVDGTRTKDDVTCYKCLQTKAYATAITAAECVATASV